MADSKDPERGGGRGEPAARGFVAQTREHVRPAPEATQLSAPLAPAAGEPPAHTTSGRRRFGDGEGTVVMPLAEILRARHAQTQGPGRAAKQAPPRAAPAGEGFGSQSTVIMRMPELPRRPAARPAASPPGDAAAAEPGRLEPTQPAVPLEARGPPAPSPPPSSPPAPAPPASEVAEPAEPLPATVPTGRFGNIVVFACKGGAGATFLALNLAHFAATKKRAACVVDLDLQFGDSLVGLGLSPALTVSAAIGDLAKKQPITADRLAHHASGVCVLSQSGSLEDLDQIRSESLPPLIENLRASFDAIVYDGARDFSDNTLAVLDLADKIVLVVVQEVLAVRRARTAFGILRKIGFDPADIAVVVNRARPEAELSLPMLTTFFAPAQVLPVPDDRPLALQSLNQAVPLIALQPAHPLTRAVGRVAAVVLGMPAEPEPEAAGDGADGRGFWSRRVRGGK